MKIMPNPWLGETEPHWVRIERPMRAVWEAYEQALSKLWPNIGQGLRLLNANNYALLNVEWIKNPSLWFTWTTWQGVWIKGLTPKFIWVIKKQTHHTHPREVKRLKINWLQKLDTHPDTHQVTHPRHHQYLQMQIWKYARVKFFSRRTLSLLTTWFLRPA